VRLLISKQDTKYKKAILIEIWVSCAIYKLTQSANILTCSELFTIWHYIVGLVFREIVMAINVVFKNLIIWPIGDKMQSIMMGFKNLCGVPNVMGAINETCLYNKTNWCFYKRQLLSQDRRLQHCGLGCGWQSKKVLRYICGIALECQWLSCVEKIWVILKSTTWGTLRHGC
jgi:hypothetical protein